MAVMAWWTNERPIFGAKVSGGRIAARRTHKQAAKSVREAEAAGICFDRNRWMFWRTGWPSPTIAQSSRAVKPAFRRRETEASIPFERVRSFRETSNWKLEAALKWRSCRTPYDQADATEREVNPEDDDR
jgi:hypothetical protein